MNFGFSDHDLFLPNRLRDLDTLFLERLSRERPSLAARFARYRAHEPFAPVERSALLVEASRSLAEFVAELFGVSGERDAARARVQDEAVLFKFRFSVFQKRTARKFPDAASIASLDSGAVEARGRALVAVFSAGLDPADEERRVARAGWDLFDLAGSLASPRSRDASYTPEAAHERLAHLRARAAGMSLPVPADDAALVKEWAEAFVRRGSSRTYSHCPGDSRSGRSSRAGTRSTRPARMRSRTTARTSSWWGSAPPATPSPTIS